MKAVICICLGLFVPISASAQNYILIGWNDLGMHCSNKNFSTLAVLPPYNVVLTQAIQTGDADTPPAVVTAGLHVTYEIPGNTYSVGKTDFWDYEDRLFGVNLPPNVGLTGNGLTGQMTPVENYFTVTGIPITPFTDADLINEDPFQLGLLKLYDASEQLLATAQPVVPVSNEINCLSSSCHTSEQKILDEHALEAGFDPDSTPILCASCHASNALGTPRVPGVPPLSEAVHLHHGVFTHDCYKCHPGPNTQCLRDVMSTQHGLACQDCHGSVTEVGESISNGREPWLNEPSCGSPSCHGPNYAEESGKLYRHSRGHGGLFCSVCHGEPHAIVPSREMRDNVQMVGLQGHAGTLGDCAVCHGVAPTSPGPHGATACPVRVNGDVNLTGDVTSADIIYLVGYVFRGEIAPKPCAAAGNVNCDPSVTSADIIWLVNYVFRGGTAPCDICTSSPMSCV